MISYLSNDRINLRTGIQGDTETAGGVSTNILQRYSYTGRIQTITAFSDIYLAVAGTTNTVTFFRLQNPGSHKIMLGHTNPAGIGFTLIICLITTRGIITVKIFKGYFFKFTIRGIQYRTSIGVIEIACTFRFLIIPQYSVSHIHL